MNEMGSTRRTDTQMPAIPPISVRSEESPDAACCSSSGCCSGSSRREFLQVVGLGAAVALTSKSPVMAGPFEASDFEKLVPADKRLDPSWVKSLTARGEPTVYSGADLGTIGMPIGGICAGQLYLGGDGTLWHWDIFNRPIATNDAHYAQPLRPDSPLDQGFAVKITSAGTFVVRPLSRAGFSDIHFRGEYPIGFVQYRDPEVPVSVSLEAFSPFIPLNTEESSLPATVLRFTVKNTSAAPVGVELAGWLENAVCLDSGKPGRGSRHNQIRRETELIFLECTVVPAPAPAKPPRSPLVFTDFEGTTYGDWTAQGEAFGKRPGRGAVTIQSLSGFVGKGLVNTWTGSDAPQGKLTSPVFTIERPFISFLIGGGRHPGRTCINLRVEGQVVRTETGGNSDAMNWADWDVRDLAGKRAQIEVVDNESGGWGHIDIDRIEFGDLPRDPAVRLDQQHDFGTMGLALLDPHDTDRGIPSIPVGSTAEEVFGVAAAATKPFGPKLVGAIVRPWTLAPGQEQTATFVVTWHFPNLSLPGTRLPASLGRHYASRFPSAVAVARHVASHFASLHAQTMLWHRTWYDSTLPYWFLDRTFANTSILATSTCHRFRDGRFYGWEGVGCCAGTCTHVWQYAQAVARLFPELERITRERVDYAEGVAFDPKTGIISHRAEEPVGPAVDGQAGTILRAYREHQMSADHAFLRRNWPKIKKSLEYLIRQDSNGDGILEGPQHNTLDAEWFGKVPWLSSLYVAALRAGEAMAGEIGDLSFAAQARAIAARGATNLVDQLWSEPSGYFVQRPDPSKLAAVGSFDGCHVDQVFGQHWAYQVNLGTILSPRHVRQALQSLWRYNFTPDVGPYRQAHRAGRWYAMAGEAGLIMVTFPKGISPEFKDHPSAWSAMYFNECMNGFEYQVAGHMLWEGLVTEGLAVTRAVHDRYHASRRNPWNEVECGDHYARSMASYGVFLAACGYEYHGPQGHLGFAPRLTPTQFRAAFTTAEGWGIFSQRREGQAQVETIALKYGHLRLRTLRFAVADDMAPSRVAVTLRGKGVGSHFTTDQGHVVIALEQQETIEADQELTVVIAR